MRILKQMRVRFGTALCNCGNQLEGLEASATINPFLLTWNSSPIVFHIQTDLTTNTSSRGGKPFIQNNLAGGETMTKGYLVSDRVSNRSNENDFCSERESCAWAPGAAPGGRAACPRTVPKRNSLPLSCSFASGSHRTINSTWSWCQSKAVSNLFRCLHTIVQLFCPGWGETASVYVEESGTSENLRVLSRCRVSTKV